MNYPTSQWFADDPVQLGKSLTSASDEELAAVVAERAGEILFRLRQEKPTTPDKESLRELRDLADRVSHDYLVAALGAAREHDAILSEEGADDLARLTNRRTWIIDPLDGTNEYGLGRWDFAVHVALWQDGQLAVGVVAMPSRDLVLRSDGAYPPLKPKGAGEPWRLVVSRTRPPANLSQVLNEVENRTGRRMEILDVGSVGAKVGEIVAGRADAYVHTTGFFEWDVAAPAAVARAAGLHVSHVDGEQLVLNQANPKVKNLLVARPELAAVLLELDIA